MGVSILANPTLELVLSAGIVSVVASVIYGVTDKDRLSIPLMVVVSAIDVVAALTMLKVMLRRLRDE